ncbi:10967_t:CDS:2 [Funneliformis geosporum]|nr:10967_t:CDS:2 [Funneliformis geosporum]
MKDASSNESKTWFPIYFDHNKQKMMPRYVHPNLDIHEFLTPHEENHSSTGKMNRWSQGENNLFLEYLSVNFYQWQYHKEALYKWLSKVVFQDQISDVYIFHKWKNLRGTYFDERRKTESVQCSKLSEERVKSNKSSVVRKKNRFWTVEEEILLMDLLKVNIDEYIERQLKCLERIQKIHFPQFSARNVVHKSYSLGKLYKLDKLGSKRHRRNKYPKQEQELWSKANEFYTLFDQKKIKWTVEEEILLIDVLKNHVEEYVENENEFLKRINEKYFPTKSPKRIKLKLIFLSPGYHKKHQARLNKKNVTEQDRELLSKAGEVFPLIKKKRKELNVKRMNDGVKKRLPPRRKAHKTQLLPKTLKVGYKISLDHQNLFNLGRSLLKYIDDEGNKTSEMLEEVVNVEWPESTVYDVCWKRTQTKLVIKKFDEGSTKEMILNEIHLMEIMRKNVIFHPNIIKFYGITNIKDEINYELMLEYADGGTLGRYLRENASTFKWESQLKFANDIATDFGYACLQGSGSVTKAARGVIPYMDPKIFENPLYDLNKKSDIYSLGVLFWELTSRSSPFNFETTGETTSIQIEILNGKREKPIIFTNDVFVKLYQKCWEHEPDGRPNVDQVISELNSIDPNSCDNSKENEESEIIDELKYEEDFSLYDVKLYY